MSLTDDIIQQMIIDVKNKSDDPSFYTRRMVHRKYPDAKCIPVGFTMYQVIDPSRDNEPIGRCEFSHDKAWFSAYDCILRDWCE
jgi:hypothetical protein